MRILLTGAGGQLGRALAPALAELGEITALDRAALDVADETAVRRAVAAARPAAIVNAAAYTAVDRAEAEPEAALAANARGPENLARAAAAAGCALVHFSTDYVFDGEGDSPWREDDATEPVNAYGRSKLAGERAVAASGAAHLILRTSWLYGPTGRNFLTTMLRLGAAREELTVVDDQIGAPTSSAAVAAATAAILARAGGDPAGMFKAQGGIVHLACRGQTSWHGFAEAIFAEARAQGVALEVRALVAVPTEDYPTPAPRPRNSRLDLARLEDRYGIRPPAWRRALKAVMADYANGC